VEPSINIFSCIQDCLVNVCCRCEFRIKMFFYTKISSGHFSYFSQLPLHIYFGRSSVFYHHAVIYRYIMHNCYHLIKPSLPSMLSLCEEVRVNLFFYFFNMYIFRDQKFSMFFDIVAIWWFFYLKKKNVQHSMLWNPRPLFY